jgi:parvulin-like peptidyl-prolyl isomerase
VAALSARTRGGLALALLLWSAGAAHLFASEAPPGQSGNATGPIDRVLVRVNGHAIMASEVDRVLAARVPILTGHGSISPERMAAHRKQLLQELVVQRLELDEARRRGLTVSDAEVAQAEANLKARFPDANAYARAIAAQGLDPAAIRQGLADHMLGRKVEDQIQAQVPEPTPEQLKAYHAEHPEKFRIPARADVTYVLASVDPSAPQADWDAARARVVALKARVKGGEAFAQVAAAARADPGFKVVALGLVHEGQADIAEIDKAAFALAAGQDSDAVWTLYGYAMVHVGERQPGRQLAFDDLNLDLFKREWRRAREGDAMRAWVADLMAHADLKFGDAAAAPEGAAPAQAAGAPGGG